jgi:hypothetical protein
MGQKKKKKKKHKKTVSPTVSVDASKPPDTACDRASKNTALVLDIALVIAILVIAIQLFRYASAAYFFTDECYHGLLARHAMNFSYPAYVPEIFTERWSFMPPLLHAFAGVMGLISRTDYVFRYANVVLLLGAISGGYFLLRRYTNPRVARIAMLTTLTCPLVYIYALRFYQEEITFACMMFGSILLFATARESSRWRLAAATGALFGLTIIAKQTGLVLFGVVMALGFLALRWLRLGRKGDFKRTIVLAAAMVLVASPYLLRNLIAFGNPFFPFFSNSLFPVYHKLQGLAFPISTKQLFVGIGSFIGPVFLLSSAFAAIMLLISVWRRRFERGTAVLWILLLICAAAFALGPGGQPRHWIALIPVMAILAATGLAEAFSKKRIWLDLIAGVLVVYVILLALDMPNYRSKATHGARGKDPLPMLWVRFPRIEPTKGFDASDAWNPVLNALKSNTTEDDLLLSPWAYTPAYHVKLRVTWPDAISPKSPIDMFKMSLKQGRTLDDVRSRKDFTVAQYTPERKEELLIALREHGITFVALYVPFCHSPEEAPHCLRYPFFMWYSLFRLRTEGKIKPIYNDFRVRKVNGRLEPTYYRDQYGRPRPRPKGNNPFIILRILK